MPTIVIESCWSESFTRLRSDKDEWLLGTIEVRHAFLKWSEISGKKVKGIIEVWSRGNPTVKQMVSIPLPIYTSPTKVN